MPEEQTQIQPVVAQREKVTLDQLKAIDYVSLKVGETVEITIKNLEKVQVSPDFSLSGVSYRYEITTSDDKVVSISAWALWKAVREALDKIKSIEGVKLRLSHLAREQYTAEIIQ